ncbi:hypothetical protein DAI22_08g026301 [Oryza sativa Japonica Group]|nr:hypothetical protein DAI22_08g026301 [Oryza sativa Japonica Group]
MQVFDSVKLVLTTVNNRLAGRRPLGRLPAWRLAAAAGPQRRNAAARLLLSAHLRSHPDSFSAAPCLHRSGAPPFSPGLVKHEEERRYCVAILEP